MMNRQPVLLRAVDAWRTIIAKLADQRLSCAEAMALFDLCTQTFALCRDRQELTWLSGELRGMVRTVRDRQVSRNGKFH